MLEASEARDDARERHLAHFLALARSAQAHFFGPAIRDWLARTDGDPRAMQRGKALHALGQHHYVRGHFALEAAARLQGASDGAVDAAGGTRTWFDDRVLAALHEKPAAMLATDVHAAAYDAGRALPLKSALAEASGWLADAHARIPAQRRASPGPG